MDAAAVVTSTPTEPPPEGREAGSLHRRLLARVREMEQVRDQWTATWWRDIRDFCLPQHGQFTLSERTQQQRNTARIIDPTATLALRTFANGMLVGVTPPSRPWFMLGLEDQELEAHRPVALWLERVRDLMLRVLRNSNFYAAVQSQYLNLGAFGTAAMGAFEDFRDVVRFHGYPIGSYALANDAQRRVNAFCHRCVYTARQVVEKFGLKHASQAVRAAWEAGRAETPVEVVQIVVPNPQADAKRLEARFKPWLSYYIEEGAPGDEPLGRSGFDAFPILAPRFVTEGDDAYGQSPAMDLLGHIKALQTLHRQKARGVEKMVDPPLMGPSSLRGQQISTQPSRINYIDVRDGMLGLEPIYKVNLPIGEVRADIQDIRHQINIGLFSDLFLMLQQSDRRSITAEEIRARAEEKILALSPLMERLDDELLDPLIDRTFEICERFGLFPPPPEEMQGQRLRVVYTSTMAQIQRTMALGTSERLVGFVGSLVGANPEVMDNLDLDATVREYARDLGAAPAITRDQKDIAAMREAWMQAARQQAEMAQAEAASRVARTLSQAEAAGGEDA